MNRCGYSDDIDNWALIKWRGAVSSAIRGKKGQAFLKELLATLDALPEKKLVANSLIKQTGEVCALGSMIAKRGISVKDLGIEEDEEDTDNDFVNDNIASRLNIAPALVREIEYVNDDAWDYPNGVSDEKRFEIVRNWVSRQINEKD